MTQEVRQFTQLSNSFGDWYMRGCKYVDEIQTRPPFDQVRWFMDRHPSYTIQTITGLGDQTLVVVFNTE